ncbi:MAG: PKD domain-containing protein [Flavobacteriales bacterium]
MAGTYTCTITDDAGCTTSHTETVGEPTPVTVATAASVHTCADTPVTLEAQGSGGTPGYAYTWTPEGPTVTPASTTAYTVIATDANGCTSAPARTEVQVGAAIAPAFNADTTGGCAPLCVGFAAADLVEGLHYAWSFGDGESGDGAATTHCYPEGGTYDVVLTISDDEGCAGSIVRPALIRVWPQPVAHFDPSVTTTTTEHPTVLFLDNSTGAARWDWRFGDRLGSSSTERSPAFTFAEAGCYTVTLAVTNDPGCVATAALEICVEDSYAVYVPNTFTPNNDGINDLFGVVASVRRPTGYILTIFDRWGAELFTSTQAYQGWDGSGLPDGVYVWKLSIRDAEGQLHEHVGHVTLLR